jgi:hypothetical protein
VSQRTILAAVLLAAALFPAQARAQAKAPPPSEGETKSLNLSAYAELLRSDLRAQKVAIITEVVGFTEAEDKVFWPIYREYDVEMAKLGDERLALIAEYAGNYSALTDAVAEKLASKALDLEARRQAVKAKFFEQFKTALTPRTALRFLQVEHQLLLLIELQISASLPIAK